MPKSWLQQLRDFFEPSSNKKIPPPTIPPLPLVSIDTERTDFTTQKDIIKQVNGGKGPGICAPLTNLYVKFQMGLLENKNFLRGSHEEIYHRALKERNMMKTHTSAKSNGADSAFKEAGLDYHVTKWPTFFIGSKSHYDWILSKADHHIITMPSKTKTPQGHTLEHEIAFGKTHNNLEQCYLFDANRPGGEYIDSCDNVTKIMASSIRESHALNMLSCSTVISATTPNASLRP